ncbi:MAG: bacillithiol biosynthesis cysteine-adding enzyme BshC [Acidobacteria bacterium]|nr:bacillithiol biosynthesis cysteine-adding enzyme BshC [Acidobacteriota bacterium]
MSSGSDAAATANAIRASIDLRRFPWVRPLVSVYATEFERVAPLFAGDPAQPAAWRDRIARVAPAARHRALMADVLSRQLGHRDAPRAARAQVDVLASPQSVAIVTGQQAGLFGGPLYTVLKAVTAIQLARRIQQEHGVPTVPVFWVDAEDHDWDEIRSAALLDRELNPASVSLESLTGAGSQPVAALRLDHRIQSTIDALTEALPPSEFTADVVAILGRRYRAGVSVSTAFAGLLDDLLGHHGLVVYESADPLAKPAVADLFASELSAPGRTSELVRAAGDRLRALGHEPQVEPAPDGVNLFYLGADGRAAIRRRDGQYFVGDGLARSADELAAEAKAHPERFSPNVILRPLVQDRLFPTICYVAGPAELAYQAQLGDVYRTFGIEAPLLHSRATATLLDSAAAKFLDRYDVPFEAFQVQDDLALNRLLERQLPPEIERIFAETEQQLDERVGALRAIVPAVDPTLTGAADTTLEKIRDTLRHLQTKIVQASKRKDDTLRRQFTRTRALLFPGGHPQERVLNVAFFANRYGLRFADRLVDVVPADTSRHHLIVL